MKTVPGYLSAAIHTLNILGHTIWQSARKATAMVGVRSEVNARASSLLARHQQGIYRRTDHIFIVLLIMEWLAGIMVANFLSPRSWAGMESRVHIHLWAAIVLGGAIISFPVILAVLRPGSKASRHSLAIGQMLIGALLIHLTGGRIETHFHIFGSLAFLAFYRDWPVLVTASVVVTLDHFLRGEFWTRSIFGTASANPLRWLEHAGWVVFEVVFLIPSCLRSVQEMSEIALRRAENDLARERVEEEARQRTNELRASESVVRSFFDSAPMLMGVVEIKEDDIIYVSANAATAEFFGLPPEAMSEASARQLKVPRRYRKIWIEKYRESAATGRPVHFEFAYQLAGNDQCMSATVSHIQGTRESRTCYSYVVEDVSARKRADEGQAAQYAAMRTLATSATLEETLPRLMEEIGTNLRLTVGEYWSLDAEARVLRYSGLSWAAPGPYNAFLGESNSMTFAFGVGLPGRIWSNCGPILIENLTMDPEFVRSRLAAECGLRGALGFPVVNERGLLGVMVFLSSDTLTVDDSLFRVMSTLGRQIGLFIENRHAEEALRRSEAEARKLAMVAARTDNAVVISDASGRVEWANEAFSRLSGYSLEEVAGKTPGSFLHGSETDPATVGYMRDQIRSGEGFRTEVLNYAKDGRKYWLDLEVRPVTDASGFLSQFIGIQRDVTERRRTSEELLRAKDAAESASRAKGEFLANMSHEIRTPMNGILGMTELALETDVTPRQREYLSLVKSSAEALLTVINDILDFSKIEAGKLELDPAPFRLREALEDTVRTLASRAHGKGLELALRIAPDVPDALVGDVGRLRQVVVNLIGNAIKFTERGEVVLQAQLVEQPGRIFDGEVVLEFAVSDTGIGIPAAKLGKVFEPFEQADNSTTRRHGGTGLGLTISTKLVALMGGQIQAESQVGSGSRFFFTTVLGRLPLAEAFVADKRTADLENLRVLVVDDNATNRRILEEVLAGWGSRTESADSGVSALNVLLAGSSRRDPFAAAVLDFMMPEMDGLELAQRIKSHPEFEQIALILMTSDGLSDSTARYRDMGFSACLSKPLRQSELYDALSDAIGSATDLSATRCPTRVDLERRETEDTVVGSNGVKGLRILLAEDNPVNQRVATLMLEGLQHRVTVVGDGKLAVEALESEVYDAVLMDVQMPVMDGFEAVVVIRAASDDSRMRIPIIALTAHAMKGDRERCLAAGFDGYLTKPVRADAIREELKRLIPAQVCETTPSASQRTALSGILYMPAGGEASRQIR